MKNRPQLRPCHAGLLSAFIWGGGQAANKQYRKGALFFLLQISCLLLELCTGNYAAPAFTVRENSGFFVKGFWGLFTLGTTPRKLSLAGLSQGDHSVVLLVNGLIVCIVTLFILFLYGANIYDAVKNRRIINETGLLPVKKGSHSPFPLVILIPSIVLLLFLSLMPIVFNLLIAFTNYNRSNLPPANLVSWVGFKNFVNMFTLPVWSKTFFSVFVWTLVWALVSTVTCYFAGFIQAVILNNKKVKLRKMWRGIFILPWAIPSTISLLVFKVLFNGQFGPISQFLMDIGITQTRISWFTDAGNPNLARIMVIIINLWLGFPYFMAMITGVMTSISTDVFEAARIDGVSPFQEFTMITFPLVLSATSPLLVMSFAGNFNNFGIIYFLTSGGPNNPSSQFAGSTDILITWIYKLTLDNQMFNMAAVMSIVIFVIIGGLSLWNFSRSGALKEEQ